MKPMTRAHRSLIVLAATTVLATGLTSQALAAPAGIGSDIGLAASLLLLIVSATLLMRVGRHLYRPAPPTRRRRPPTDET